MKKTIWILAASSLLFAYGCHKTTSGGGVQSAQQEADKDAARAVQEADSHVARSVAEWHKTEINSLLTFIPSDAPVVFISTREYDMNAAEMKSLLAHTLKLYDLLLLGFIEGASAKDKEIGQHLGLYIDKEIRPSFEDYKNTAPLWGMDPLGRTDSVMYLTGDYVVLKQSVNDSAIFAKKVESLLINIEEYFGAQAGQVLPIEALAVLGEAWISYGLSGVEHTVYMHYGKSIVTLVIPHSRKMNLDALHATLVPAPVPVDKSVFGALGIRPASLGFVDTKRLVDMTLKRQGILGKDLSKMFLSDAPVSAVCEKEIGILANIFPRTFIQIATDGQSVTLDFTAVPSSKEVLSTLQGLTSTVMDFSDNKMIGSLAVSFDVSRLFNFLLDTGEHISKKPFHCDSLNFLNKFAELVSSVPDILASPMLEEYAAAYAFFMNLTSFSAYVWNVEYDEDNEIKNMTMAMNLLGKDFTATLQPLVQIADDESLNKLTFEKGKVETIDNSKTSDDWLRIIQSLVTDTGLIVTTNGEGLDIEVLGKTKPKKTNNFVSIMLDYGAFSQIRHDVPRLDMKYGASLGVDDKGLRLRIVTEL
ncbi:MAG: hypothetical protein FWC40_03415 [Proteobacteria bacterium]|nr:hypothetical protein [Pseudomonadota bacterium]